MIFTFKFKSKSAEHEFALNVEQQETQNIVLAQTKFSSSLTYTSHDLGDGFIEEALNCYTNHEVELIEVLYDGDCIATYNEPDLRVYITNENSTLHNRVEIISAR